MELAFEAHDYTRARVLLEELLSRAPSDPLIKNKLAHSHLRLGDRDKARRYFTQAALHLESGLIPIYSGLAELEGAEENFEAARDWGRRSLRLNYIRAKAEAERYRQPHLSTTKGQKKIISFSLYGTAPKYSEGLLLTLKTAAQYYPEFKCRIYTDGLVPHGVMARIEAAGGEIVYVSKQMAGWHPTMWRFAALSDPEAHTVLIRDVDSPILERETILVGIWANSGKAVHIIRDWYAHTPLILAGLFGLQGKRLDGLDRSIEAYLERSNHHWGVDQDYLRDVIWSVVADEALIHDSVFFGEDHPLDPPESMSRHIGVSYNMATASTDQSVLAAGLNWVLKDEESGIDTVYPAVDQEGRAAIVIPKVVADGLDTHSFSLRIEKTIG